MSSYAKIMIMPVVESSGLAIQSIEAKNVILSSLQVVVLFVVVGAFKGMDVLDIIPMVFYVIVPAFKGMDDPDIQSYEDLYHILKSCWKFGMSAIMLKRCTPTFDVKTDKIDIVLT
jgi:hypothetical protein